MVCKPTRTRWILDPIHHYQLPIQSKCFSFHWNTESIGFIQKQLNTLEKDGGHNALIKKWFNLFLYIAADISSTYFQVLLFETHHFWETNHAYKESITLLKKINQFSLYLSLILCFFFKVASMKKYNFSRAPSLFSMPLNNWQGPFLGSCHMVLNDIHWPRHQEKIQEHC